MNDLNDRIARLSSEKRALLEAKLREQNQVAREIPRSAEPPTLSFAQERMWLLERLEPGLPLYNLPLAFRARGHIDVEVLRKAIDAIAARHDALRMRFFEDEGRPVCGVAPPAPIELKQVSLAFETSSEREQALEREIWAECRRPFDLGTQLLRVVLFRLDEDDHVLLLLMHHIVMDLWSEGILIRDLSVLYSAFARAVEPVLPELPIRYTDFAAWQRERLSGRFLEEQLAYWREKLSNAPASLDLPMDRPRPPIPRHEGSFALTTFGRESSEALRRFSRQERVTPFMTLFSGFLAVLHRYTGAEDVVVGTPIAGRTHAETEALVGLFINTLALRTDISGDPTFRTLLGRIRQTTLEAYEHQELPFEKLIETLNPIRNRNQAPLFHVLFSLQNARAGLPSLPGLTLEPVRAENGTSKFDLSLYVTEHTDGYHVYAEYDVALFDSATIHLFLSHYVTLLSAAILEPATRVSRLPLLTKDERELLVRWNETSRRLEDGRGVVDRIHAQALMRPRACALVCGERRVTYRDLVRKSDALAAELRRRGVGPGAIVGVALKRSPEMVIAVLAVLTTGGGYLPLDPALPADRLAYMLEDAGASILLTDTEARKKLPPSTAEQIVLDAREGPHTDETPGNGLSRPDDIAYLIYTSGSTGRPKGVEVPHRALTNFLCAMENVLRPSPSDVLVSVTTLSFDIAALEIMMPLVTGGRVVIAREQEVGDGRLLRELIDRSGATLMQATPSTWRLLVDSGWPGRSDLTILCGGEALPRDLADELLSRGRKVWNLYGPTETTIWSTVDEVTSFGPITIGRPILNTRLYILDPQGQQVPVGVPGELFIGGAGIALGYHGRPELTAERFVTLPLDPQRLYRTGDRVRFREDGRLEYLGRLDQQVKLRGYRIELGEIEAILRESPSVADAAVDARGEGDGRRLIAWVIPSQGSDIDAGELRTHLRKRLPEYMVPADFCALAIFPRTPNNKLDRKSLPDLSRSGVTPPTHDAPQGDLELALAGIWERVLGREGFGREDNFFDSGGNSLLAVQLFAQIEKAYRLNLPLATLFEAPTIRGLGDRIRSRSLESDWLSLVPIQPEGTKPPFYCIHAAGGNVLTYFDLARHLGLDQPVYGLQARGLDGKRRPHNNLEEMARDYIKEIREFQPKGPYYLGGTSFGGMIAFEMAQQLVAQGQTVGVLALFDTYGPGYPRYMPGMSPFRIRCQGLLKRFDLHVGNLLATKGLRAKLSYFGEKSTRLRHRGRVNLRGFKKNVANLEFFALPATLRKVEQASRRATLRYQPKPYPARMTLFRASEQPAGVYPDPELGWTPIAQGRVEVFEVPGHHGAVVYEPRVGILARELARCLEKAYAGQAHATGTISP